MRLSTKSILTLLALAMMISLFACDGGKDEIDTNAPSQTTEKRADETTEARSDETTDKKTEQTTEDRGETTDSESTGASETESSSLSDTSTDSESPTDSSVTGESSTNTDAQTETETETEENTEEVVIKTYDRYDLLSYMTPYWSGRVVHNETVMFVGKQDKAKLLYTADEIISVRSYDLKTEYIKGVDYDYVDGYLILLEETSIPVISESEYYSQRPGGEDWLKTKHNGVPTSTYWGDGTIMTRWQVAVTYKHSEQWDGAEIPSYKDRFESFINKLQNGDDVTVIFYGDSITAGATASWLVGADPKTPTYSQLFVNYVAAHYGYKIEFIDVRGEFSNSTGLPSNVPNDISYGNNGTITYINTAVGGWTTEQGLANVKEYIEDYIDEYGCDLFVLAFGMNNGGSQATDISNKLEQVVNRVTAKASDIDVLLIATMLPNPESIDRWYGNQITFEPYIKKLSEKLWKNGVGCATVPMTSISQSILEVKRFRDITGNNINHPNDFVVRAYAQAIIQTVFGYEHFADMTASEGVTAYKTVLKYDVNKILTSAGTYYQVGKELKQEGDIQFVRFTSTAPSSNPAGQIIFTRYPLTEAGASFGPDKTFNVRESKYLVLKMRASDTDQKFQLCLGTSDVTYNAKSISLKLETSWTTYVIDLTKAYDGAYNANSNGRYDVMTLYYHLGNFIGDTTVDIQYMEFCSDWKTVVDTDTVQMIGKGGAPSTLTAEGKCVSNVAHSYIASTETKDGNITYSYVCEFCSDELKAKTLPDSVKLVITPVDMKNASLSHDLAKNDYYLTYEENGESFIRVNGGKNQKIKDYGYYCFMPYANQSGSTETGRYLVVKFRVGKNGLGMTNIEIWTGTEGPTATKQHELLEISSAEDDQWHIAVVDIEAYMRAQSITDAYNKADDGKYYAKFLQIRPFSGVAANANEDDYIDYAYVVFCNDLDTVREIVGNDTCEYYAGTTAGTLPQQ